MNIEDLLRGSEHKYDCRCETCAKWWDMVGPEMEDEDTHSDTCFCKECREQKTPWPKKNIVLPSRSMKLSRRAPVITKSNILLAPENSVRSSRLPATQISKFERIFNMNINEIKALADNNLIMPPKSTYIEPKFRSGLVVYEL